MGVTLDNIRNYVTAKQNDPKTVFTGRKETAYCNKLMSKKRTGGGAIQEFSIDNDAQADNTKWYLPDDPTSDFVGTVAGENNYSQIEPVAQAQWTWSFISSELRYSQVQYQIAKTGGPRQLAKYLDTRLEFTSRNAKDRLGQGLINGKGNGFQDVLPGVASSTGREPYGIIYQNRAFSGALDTNVANPVDNLHFGRPRHLHRALVGNPFDAVSGYGATVAAAGATFTADSTEISGLPAADYAPNRGWEIWVDFGSGFENLGREYQVGDTAAAGGSATTIQMTQVFRGVAGAYDVELRAPFNVTNHGAIGAITTAKLNKGYYAACDDTTRPDIALSNTRTFGAVSNFLVDVMRWTLARDSDYETKQYDNFKYQGATWCADNNFADGRVEFINTDYTFLECLEGMDDYKIMGKDIIELPSQVGNRQYGCNKTFVAQQVCESPRSNAYVAGLAV